MFASKFLLKLCYYDSEFTFPFFKLDCARMAGSKNCKIQSKSKHDLSTTSNQILRIGTLLVQNWQSNFVSKVDIQKY